MDSKQVPSPPKRALAESMIKPGELIDVIEVTPLTLNDRKIYNLLIHNAGNNIDQPVEHSIEKESLRLSRRGDDRPNESILRLMGAVARVKTMRNGEPSILRVQLLGRNIEHDRDDGNLYYTFDPLLREIFSNSEIFGRLKMKVMLSFSGKYGLTLYEMIEKRVNMRRAEEIFPLAEFRNLLGVAKGKLNTWNNLKTRAIEPGVEEVNQLSPTFSVSVEGIKTGRRVTHVKVQWRRKAPDGEEAAWKEQVYSKVGRAARRRGEVEQVEMALPATAIEVYPRKLETLLTDRGLENGRQALLKGSKGIGLQTAIQMWEEAFRDQALPDNPNGAFVNFCKKIA
jgi:hypothetical protein